MKRRILALATAVGLAISLSACGPKRDYDDDDDDGGWFPVFIPWSQPHQPSHKSPTYRTPTKPLAPAPKAPAYRAPAPAPRAPSMPRSK